MVQKARLNQANQAGDLADKWSARHVCVTGARCRHLLLYVEDNSGEYLKYVILFQIIMPSAK